MEDSKFAMRVWKKLQNPFALVGQGFVLGGILFFAFNGPGEASPALSSAPVAAQAVR